MSAAIDDDLHRLVDGELEPSRRAEVEAYIGQHPEAADRVRELHRLNAGLRALSDPELSEPVPAKFLTRPAARDTRWRWIGMAAGLFAIGVVTGWLVHGVISTPVQQALSLPRQAAIAHAVYSPDVRRPVEISAEHEDQLVTWLSKRLGTPVRAPKLGAQGFELVGGRLLPGSSGPVAQFMYQDASGQRLTLYVSNQIPANQDTAFRFSQEGQVNVFYWIDGKFGYALSAGLDKGTLARVASTVYDQINRR